MSYEVKPGGAEVRVHSGESVRVQFTVNNTTDRALLTQSEIGVGGSVDRAWCTVDPAGDVEIPARGSKVYAVTIAPVGVAQPTSGHVRLTAASVDDPTDAAPSPPVPVTLLEPRPTTTWWQRHGTKVLIGAGVLIVALVLAIVFSGGGGVEITRFAATPSTGLQVGTPVTLAWAIDGEPSAVSLRVGTDEPLPIEQGLWKDGAVEWTPSKDGATEVRLTAFEPGGDPNEPPFERARTLNLDVAPPPATLAPPVIDSFTVTPASVRAGQPTTFAWRTSGDTAALRIDLGDGAPPTITDPARLPAGTVELLFTPGEHRAIAELTGKDGTVVRSDAVAFTVQPDTSMELPQVDFTISTSGRSLSVVTGRVQRFQNLVVDWSVRGDHTSVELAFRTGDGQQRTESLPASGTRTFENVWIDKGTVVQLLVGQRGKPKLVYERTVGVAIDLRWHFERELVLRNQAVIGTVDPAALRTVDQPSAAGQPKVVRPSGSFSAVRERRVRTP
ncbi:MAG: hypothetical protein IPM29_22145 [Planctomycetes bacterium]|nr:hypothetical protein [Planctomycetota bacterium]